MTTGIHSQTTAATLPEDEGVRNERKVNERQRMRRKKDKGGAVSKIEREMGGGRGHGVQEDQAEEMARKEGAGHKEDRLAAHEFHIPW